jgi:hypothetical protein
VIGDPRTIGRAGLTTADVLIGLAAVILILAFAAPTMRARQFQNLLGTATADIETLRTSALGSFSASGEWPAPGGAGVIPPEVAAAFPGDSLLVRDEYWLQWSVFEVVEQVEAAPGSIVIPEDADAAPDSVGPELVSVIRVVGGIVISSGNDALLAELLANYGTEVSFVRDSMWTLIVGSDPAR